MTNCTKHFTKGHIKVFKNFPELEYTASLRVIKVRQTFLVILECLWKTIYLKYLYPQIIKCSNHKDIFSKQHLDVSGPWSLSKWLCCETRDFSMKSQYLETKSNTEKWNSYFHFTLCLSPCVPLEDIIIKHPFGFIFKKWKAICFNFLLQMCFRRAINYKAIDL